MVPKTVNQKQTRWSEAKAAEVLEAQRQSGLSAQNYAKREGIDYQRLHRWAQRLETDSNQTSVGFLPVSVRAEPRVESTQIEVVVRSGHVVRLTDGFNPHTLKSVLRALEAAC